ncbi:MAG: reverse gyrase [candidate division WOR-3 bacterium]|uniref:Reverse gyrase n=1 Tax=candidate division WOR-3 bacterium TaxID=2052148 RepID=A0A7C4S1A8_UNCW3
MIKSIYKNLCPNCGGEITSERLIANLPCKKCEKESGEIKKIKELQEKLKEWEKHFEKHIKGKPWGLQTTWAKRIFTFSSFALLAPTGIGKTSFGLSIASFLLKFGQKSYIIVPTRLLVEQVYEKLKNFGVNEKDLLAFDGGLKKKKKERLQKGEFKILITTSMFLYKNQSIIPKEFSFIFIDDVDSFLKTAKNIDKVLYLLGFDEESIKEAINFIKLKGKKQKSEEDLKRIEEISSQLRKIKENLKGVLVVSSATANPRSSRVKLFRELLGFEVGVPTFYLRNIVDVYTEESSLIDWIKKLGKGGLLFLPSDKGKESIEEIIEILKANNIKALSYEEINEENLELYRKGEIDILVGIASFRNPLARGFDMPDVCRYALFYGVPKIIISLKFETNLSHLLWALSSIRPFIVKNLGEYTQKINHWLLQLKKYQNLNEEFINQRENLKKKIEQLREEIAQFLTKKEIIEFLKTSEEVTLRPTEEGYLMVVSDVTGYLQASGRVSRMYAGGITKGLSLIIIDDKIAFNHLKRKIRWFSDEIDFLHISEIDLPKVLDEINADREKIKNFLIERKIGETKEILKPILIIVESPNKARTIANFFGKPIRRRIGEYDIYEISLEDRYLMITASFGHILDLTTNEGYYGVILNGEIIPIYEPIEGKEEIIKTLRKAALEVEQVLIATDPDTEGEKIGWDIKEILKPYIDDIKRMEFHEITKKAIIKAIKEPRDFDLNLIKAQILRRISDRWIGFEFSQFLHRAFGKPTLSAGRVQTPVLGWIIEREKEFRKSIYKIFINVEKNSKKLRLNFTFENEKTALDFYNNLKEIEIEKIGEREEIESPLPPYRTDTLLKDASDFYRFSLPKTMELAQTLFELGYITYHRTDSIRVSDTGINIAKEFIKEEFGEGYFQKRTWGEGGAHECIRPTKILEPEELRSMLLSGQIEGLTKEHILLYEIIFKRFIASQMKPIKVKIVDYLVKVHYKQEKISLRTEIIEPGWDKIFKLDLYPPMEGNYNIENKKEIKRQPKAYRYTQGELVFEMKQKGIGRPSTYALIIEKLLERKYVIDIKGFLVPTELGKAVYSYLKTIDEAKDLLSEEFTRKLENLMDSVENGETDFQPILYDLYRQLLAVKKGK